MKRAKLEAVLRRKIRLKITARKRGKFTVTLPPALARDGQSATRNFPTKRGALTWLLIQLRCLEQIVSEVKGGAR